MKCPKCGFITSELKVQCMRCGSALPGRKEEPARGAEAPPTAPPAPSTAQPSAGPITGAEVPEWRSQVTRKVREFGERKKLLTTPPGPIKPTPESDSPESRPEPMAPAQDEAPAPAPRPVVVEPASPLPPAPSPVPPPRQIVPPVELSAEDLADLDMETPETPPEHPPLLLVRRGCSLLLDSTVLVVLHGALIYLVSQIISHPFLELVQGARVPLLSIFLLFHYVYYAYFYKTSRQTPGQVFLGIELRDPLTSRISLVKITLRWLGLIVLNVLNLLPALLGKPLLLDQLSRTEIRTLK